MSVNPTQPTSYNEQQYWLLNQQSRAPAYNINSCFKFENLKIGRFVKAVNLVVESIELLSSSYYFDSGQIYRTNNSLSAFIIRECFTNEQLLESGDALEWLKNRSAEPFKLNNDSLVRVLIAESSESELCFVCISIHHVVLDLRSKELFSNLLSRAYNEKLVSFPEDELNKYNNYQEFVEYQSDFLRSNQGTKSLNYWVGNLENIEKFELNFPYDSVKVSNDASIGMSYSRETYLKLSKYSKEQSVSNYIVLLSLYFTLLYKYTKVDSLCVGIPLSNRQDSRFKNTFGCFVNIVPVVVEFQSNDTFEDVQRKVRMALLQSHRHQKIPTKAIFDTIDSPKRTPYNCGFTFETPMSLNLDDVNITKISLPEEFTQLELFLRLWEDDGLEGRVEYNPKKCQPGYILEFIESYRELLKNVLDNNKTQIDNINCCSSKSYGLIQTTNQTKTRLPSNLNLVSLFERQVNKTPNLIALFDRFKQITYQDFNFQVNSLAHFLIDQDIIKGEVIGILLERSIPMFIATYAVLKTGAIFVPIDTGLPKDRIHNFIRQANIKTIISHNSITVSHSITDCPVQFLDDNSEIFRGFRSNNPNIKIDNSDPAYIIFTSGSTGQPKGVINRHESIGNRLLWMQNEFSASVEDTILQKTPNSFDVSLWEIFWPLQVGSRIAIADHNSHKNPYEIQCQICNFEVSIIHFVPTMMRSFLALKVNPKHQLRVVICSGEVLDKELVEEFYFNYPDTKLINLYGPTEAAVDVSYYNCNPNDSRSSVPIGKPIDNASLYIVNDRLKLMPIGMEGQIAIGGIQVSSGYVNNQELTDTQFISNPFEPGYLYLTGDKGRACLDGNIEFLGRLDNQLKINGIRLEPEEIEILLTKYSGIYDSSVVKYSADGRESLVAFYVAKAPIEERLLLDYLVSFLPSNIVPAAVVFLDVMPLTISGKVDKAALHLKIQAIFSFRRSTRKNTVPLSETQRTIVDIWQSILSAENISIDRSFFEMGADSLSLIRVYEKLKVSVPDNFNSTHMFKYPTIRSLADYIDKNKNTKSVRKRTGDRSKKYLRHLKRNTTKE